MLSPFVAVCRGDCVPVALDRHGRLTSPMGLCTTSLKSELWPDLDKTCFGLLAPEASSTSFIKSTAAYKCQRGCQCLLWEFEIWQCLHLCMHASPSASVYSCGHL